MKRIDLDMRAHAIIHTLVILLLLAALWAASAAAQIIIRPPWPPPGPWLPPRPLPQPVVPGPVEWRALNVEARVRGQAAEITVEHVLFNPHDVQIEAEYLFPLPEGAVVDTLMLLADGQELTGELLDAEAARKRYEEIVRRQRDPALLQYSGRGALRVAVFPLPPGHERRLLLRYTQVLHREDDRLCWRQPLAIDSPAQPPARVSVRATLEHDDGIGTVYSPQAELTPEREGATRARIAWEAPGAQAPREFRLDWSLGRSGALGTLYSQRPTGGEDGYFLLLLNPDTLASGAEKNGGAEKTSGTQAKTLIAVLDRSGSMLGEKLQQAREALRAVLGQLRPGDTFNLVAFDDRVETFRPELQRADEATLAAARGFVEGIQAGGSTNIGEALQVALAQAAAVAGSGTKEQPRPTYIVFLTDGQPTVGEQRELALAEQARLNNKARARLFVFGVGDDVNARLLDRLSLENGGSSGYIARGENIEAPVARLARRLTAPVLTDLRLELAPGDAKQIYPTTLPDLFAGEQLALLGRYSKPGAGSLTLHGRVEGQARSFKLPVKLAAEGEEPANSFVPRLWAGRRIAELLDEIDLKGRDAGRVEELVALSRRYGILTPYTAFLAEEKTELTATREQGRRAGANLQALDSLSGSAGVAQRAWRGGLRKSTAAESAPADLPMVLSQSGGAPAGGPAGPGGPVTLGGGFAGAPPAAAPAGTADVSTDAAALVPPRQLGAKTFYLRAGVWQDAELEAGELEKAERIEVLSADYFKLLGSLDEARRPWLTTFREPVVFKLEGRVLRLEPPRE